MRLMVLSLIFNFKQSSKKKLRNGGFNASFFTLESLYPGRIISRQISTGYFNCSGYPLTAFVLDIYACASGCSSKQSLASLHTFDAITLLVNIQSHYYLLVAGSRGTDLAISITTERFLTWKNLVEAQTRDFRITPMLYITSKKDLESNEILPTSSWSLLCTTVVCR